MAHILIVDDEQTVRDIIAAALTFAGYQVETASNGQEAVQGFERQRADPVITDLVMPEKDGIEIVMELRKTQPDLPSIAMSGQSSHSPLYLGMAKNRGARRTLAKPFSIETLLTTVKEVMADPTGSERGSPQTTVRVTLRHGDGPSHRFGRKQPQLGYGRATARIPGLDLAQPGRQFSFYPRRRDLAPNDEAS